MVSVACAARTAPRSGASFVGLAQRENLRQAALEAAREILQTPPMARMHVKRMLNERYG